MQNWLDELKAEKNIQPVKLPESQNKNVEPTSIRRALLLVGSPRTRKSTSNSLGVYLFEQLSKHNIQTETIFIHTTTHSAERIKVMLDAVDAADLILLAFPLYVDSLPAPVMNALEIIAAHRASQSEHRQLFAAISNCGFPEPDQASTALAICENFARLNHFEWADLVSIGRGRRNGAWHAIERIGWTRHSIEESTRPRRRITCTRHCDSIRGTSVDCKTIYPCMDISRHRSLWLEATSQTIQRR